MKDTPAHLKVLEEIERECIPGLVEVLREGAESFYSTVLKLSQDD